MTQPNTALARRSLLKAREGDDTISEVHRYGREFTINELVDKLGGDQKICVVDSARLLSDGSILGAQYIELTEEQFERLVAAGLTDSSD